MQTSSAIEICKRKLSQLLSKRPPISQLKQIHAQVIISSFAALTDSLIHCYLHNIQHKAGTTLFNNYPFPSPPTLLWNLMIRAHSKQQNCSVPIKLFRQMINWNGDARVYPDVYTFTFVITASAHQSSVAQGEIVHGMVIKNGFVSNLFVGNALGSLYAVFGRMDDAYKVFGEMPERDVFSWTTLLRGYARKGEMNRACEIFREMPVRNEVSWAVIISGFTGNGRYFEALKYFQELLHKDQCNAISNEAVLVCALSACAHLGALDQGISIHAHIDKNKRVLKTPNICTVLIDMYAKCGRIDSAYQVFFEISRPDVHNFSSMISGFSIHGLGRDALSLFNRMLDENIKPNEVTLLGVLKGCSHSDLVQEGSSVFHNMENLWGITPKIEHYGCYVDLLGRAGHLEKAFQTVRNMPMDPDTVIWRILLSACRIHRNVDIGERIINHIKQLNYDGDHSKVLLSSLYASVSQWEKVSRLRKAMTTKQNNNIGCSWIELNGIVHEFRVADQLHPQIVEIRHKLNEILEVARVYGYNANTMYVSFDITDEEKEQAVSWHSEKLAIAFGLMNAIPGASIRIVKNLRTCNDCHSVLKTISKVYDREIIVRDSSRFHTFRDGNCSCNDYW